MFEGSSFSLWHEADVLLSFVPFSAYFSFLFFFIVFISKYFLLLFLIEMEYLIVGPYHNTESVILYSAGL